MNQIICVVGMTGSGKSEVADELVREGFKFVRFGQITLDIVKERGLEPSEENEKPIREEVRKEHGMGAFATLNIPKFDKLLEEGNVVADGLYSWSEYKILKEYYKERLTVIAVLAPPKLRYERLVNRIEIDDKMRSRPATRDQAQNRDFAEIENIEKGGPIAMADYYIINNVPKKELMERVHEFLNQL